MDIWRLELRRRNGAILGGLILAGMLGVAVAWRPFQSHGPMLPGHEGLSCEQCHRVSPGSTRQQLQAIVRYWLGQRRQPVALGHEPVSNAQCAQCHERPDDRHPVTRFLEPRFKRARHALAPQHCVSCHNEHAGRRLTTGGEFCVHCHEGLRVATDPATPTHAELSRDGAWATCLQCHDFHGNHGQAPPRRLEQAPTLAAVQAFLERGPDPRGSARTTPARRSGDDRPRAARLTQPEVRNED